MSTLLEKALERVVALPQDEQDAMKRDMIRRMAGEAIEEDDRGETLQLGDLV